MKEQKQDMKLPKLDDLFTSQEQRDNPVVDEVKEIELYKIGEFPDHPFRVIDDDKMEEMVKSVKEHGVLLPVIVRKRGEGNYQMISGHRRKRACELAGIDKIKCIVKDLTDYDIDAIDTSEKYEVFENPEVEIIYGDSPVINEIIFKQNSILDEDYKIVVKYFIKPTELIDGILEQVKSSKDLKDAYSRILELRKTLT